MKIFVVGGDLVYANFIKDAEIVSDIKKADVVLFTGGEDVDPSLYGCKKFSNTYSNLDRDLEEKKIFESVDPNKQVCLGICRGSQFLCVMNGGILVQHCNEHAIGETHPIDNGSVRYEITSTHHQMQYPFCIDNNDYDILFSSSVRRSDVYYGDKVNSNIIMTFGEPEIVLYHRKGLPKCLAVQGHPEMIPNSAVSKMINELVSQLVNDLSDDK